MKTILLFSGLLLATQSLIGQTTIHGRVTDEKGEALVGANIYLENSYDGASSNVDGNFRFTTTEKGQHNLRVEFIGFEPIGKVVTLNGGVLEDQFVMKEAFNQLKAVEITAGSFEAGDRKRAIELTSMDVATTAGAMGDIVAAINTLPGTTRVGESGRLFVRGGSHEETKTFIDDLLVGAPYYSSAPTQATRGRFNPFLFSGTLFNTGGYSAEYGQALSSVLLLNTTNAKIKDEINLSVIAGLGADATGTKSWETGSITASGTYFNIAPYVSLVDQNQEWNKPMEMFSNEISVKQSTGRSGLFKLYSNINHNNFSLYQNDLDNPGNNILYAQKNKHYFINTSWKNNITEKWLFFSGFSATKNIDQLTVNETPLTEELDVAHGKAGLDYQMNEKINIRFGTDYFINNYTASTRLDSLAIENKLQSNLVAGFAEANVYTSTRLVFRIGGRVEYAKAIKKANVSPRLSAAYKLGDDSQVSMAYGWFYQLPYNTDLIANRNLNFERADHLLINYQRNIHQRIFRSEVYYKKYSQLTRYEASDLYGRQNYSNAGHGYAYGLDVFFRDAKTIKNGHYWVSYSFLETERIYRDYPVKAVPTFASKHNFSIVYKHFSQQLRSMVSGDLSYSSPRPYHNPNQEGFNRAKMKSFNAINLSWAYLFKDQIIFYAAVNNVLGRKNEFGHRFSSRPDDQGRFAQEAILPGATRFYLLGVFFTFSKDKTRNQLDKIN